MRVLFLNPDEVVMICEYPSNVNREQFNGIESILSSVRKVTKPGTVDVYEVFCAILSCAEKQLSMEDAASRFPEMERMRIPVFGNGVKNVTMEDCAAFLKSRCMKW